MKITSQFVKEHFRRLCEYTQVRGFYYFDRTGDTDRKSSIGISHCFDSARAEKEIGCKPVTLWSLLTTKIALKLAISK